VEDLRSSLLIEIHHLGGAKPHSDNSSDEEDSTGDNSSDEDNYEILERGKRLFENAKNNVYPDSEIDKVL